MSNIIGPIAAVLVGLGVFAGAYFVMQNRAPAPAPAPVPVAKPDPEPAKPADLDPEPQKADPIAPTPDRNPKKADPEPPKKAAAFVVARWKAGNAEPVAKGKADDVVDLAFEKASGTIMLRTREALQLHDATTGKKINGIKADPTMSGLSSDGKIGFVVRHSGMGIDLYSDDGLAPCGSWIAPVSNYHSFSKTRFSPGGTSFVVGDSLMDADQNGKGYVFHTLSSSGGGSRWPNRLAAPEKSLIVFGTVVTAPKFGRAIYSVIESKFDQPRVQVIDPKTSKSTPLKSVTIMPEPSSINPAMELSGDSTLLLARHTGEVQVVDWRADKLKLSVTYKQWTTSYDTLRHAALTPDGKYVVVVREYPKFQVILGAGAGAVRQSPTAIELYSLDADKPGEKPVASRTAEELELRNWITAMAVSRDGKSVALAGGMEVRVMDFAAAFGVTPGKSLAPSALMESSQLP